MNIFQNKIFLGLCVLIGITIFYYVGVHSNSVDKYVTAPDASSIPTTQTSATTDHSNPQMYNYIDAIGHVGEYAKVTGTVLSVYTAKSGMTFFDYCKSYKTCPFNVVIFASDKTKFPDVQNFVGDITVTGDIKSYQGKAEIIVKSPDQIQKN